MNSVAKAVERFLDIKGWTECGGGDNFAMYAGPITTNCTHFVYVYDHGGWCFHDLSKQDNDSPESATARGVGADEVRMFLETLS